MPKFCYDTDSVIRRYMPTFSLYKCAKPVSSSFTFCWTPSSISSIRAYCCLNSLCRPPQQSSPHASPLQLPLRNRVYSEALPWAVLLAARPSLTDFLSSYCSYWRWSTVISLFASSRCVRISSAIESIKG